MTTSEQPPRHGRRLVGALVACALIGTALWVAGPMRVVELLRATDPRWALAGLLAATAAVICRGVRLALLVPGTLRRRHAIAVAAVAQAAAVFVPARAGELALPVLLRRVAGSGVATGIGVLLVARMLDVAALGAWGVAAIAAVGRLGTPALLAPAVLLVLAPLALPPTLAALDRLATRTLAPRARHRRWAHRIRRVRRATAVATAHRGRFAGACAASVAMWGCLWLLAWFLLTGMAVDWPLHEVVAGSAVASLSNLLPFNLTGNLGTLEAGWTAAFVALGRPLEVAAATGIAAHLWALLFTALLGLLGWLSLPTAKP